MKRNLTAQVIGVALIIALASCVPTGDQEEQAQSGPAQPVAPTPESAEVAAEPQSPMTLPDSDDVDTPSTELASPEALIAEWQELSEDPLVNMGETRLLVIAEDLNAHGVEYLEPILDVLADPETTKERRVFALVSLQHVVSPAMKDRLVSLATDADDDRTRGIAIQLLGDLDDASLQPLFEKFAQTDVEFVRFPALQGLAKLGSEEAQDVLYSMFDENENNWPLQDRIVQTLAETPKPRHEDMYLTAGADQMLESRSQQAALMALGEIGDAETISRLEAIKSDSTPTYIAELIDQAIAQIRERHDLPASEAEEAAAN
jgi:hypothetical protein